VGITGLLSVFIIVLLASATRYLFSSFPFQSYIKLFFLRRVVSITLPSSHHSIWCSYVLDKLVGDLSYLFTFP
jgi:hypothetical protein